VNNNNSADITSLSQVVPSTFGNNQITIRAQRDVQPKNQLKFTNQDSISGSGIVWVIGRQTAILLPKSRDMPGAPTITPTCAPAPDCCPEHSIPSAPLATSLSRRPTLKQESHHF